MSKVYGGRHLKLTPPGSKKSVEEEEGRGDFKQG